MSDGRNPVSILETIVGCPARDVQSVSEFYRLVKGECMPDSERVRSVLPQVALKDCTCGGHGLPGDMVGTNVVLDGSNFGSQKYVFLHPRLERGVCEKSSSYATSDLEMDVDPCASKPDEIEDLPSQTYIVMPERYLHWHRANHIRYTSSSFPLHFLYVAGFF